MNASTMVAAAVVDALRRAGVTDVVLAPGSRSAALALALYDVDSRGALRLHVRIDERTAGFLALGLAKGSHRPVPVVTTSGTAVANLHPAVLEALHVGERVVVISADRPASLRGTGANQTTEQAGMFGPRVPCADVAPGDATSAVAAVDAAVRRRGPSQLNLQFDGPLLPGGDGARIETVGGEGAAAGEHEEPQNAHSPGDAYARAHLAPPDGSVRLHAGPRTVVVAGDDAGPPARLLAQNANWPLLAEPTSGARTGSHAIRTYRLLLGGELGAAVERVVVTGHPTLSRPVTSLISRRDIEVVSVRTAAGLCTDPGRVARHVDSVPVAEAADGPGWLDAWRAADRRVSDAVDEVAAEPSGLALQVAAEVAAAVTPGALLTVGSSQPVRDLDLMAAPFGAGERRLVVGNRGLAGIDGTVSTAMGAALGRASSRALAYLGDLTFLHDANALILGPHEPRPDLTVVVANDDGGAIFSTLEQGGPAFAASFERVFATPHGVSVESLCRASGTAYERVTDAAGLRAALAADTRGIRVVEVPIERSARRALDERIRALA
ncbi:MAG: 2-succinyl-5-enolpyruvyl-6-hydroxy-3-cyclohexene-carboxylate synthase [Nocardioidaceae bacterium]|jgi:2-succinyl-5-enolpyruvyl-6-hydroxy-3-cyclohexene-1-carboxylate synthase|nr:2-succinyl-5-enolpyruvyl-6-hydroxy-3-cyclohexene-carboxylate synthase [Nocardioidaceae bacterium]